MTLLLSPNREERIDAARAIVARELHNPPPGIERISMSKLARQMGCSPVQLDRQLREGGGRNLPLGDVGLLGTILPGIRADLAHAWGERLIPEPTGAEAVTDVINAAARASVAGAEAAACIIAAAADGVVTPHERSEVGRSLSLARRALAQAEAALSGMGTC